MAAMSNATPAAWYADPSGQPCLRWWDGAQWTSAAVAFPPPGAPAPPPPNTWAAPPKPPSATGRHGGLFGGKHQIEEEIARLQKIVESTGLAERDRIQAELAALGQQVLPLRQERDELTGALPALRTEASGLHLAKDELLAAKAELARVQAERVRIAVDIKDADRFRNERNELESELISLREQVIETRDIAILQEAGIYQYRHPLDDAIAYKARLTAIKAQIKDAVRAGNAVKGTTNWTVNGSTREGTKMVREFSKLMLRAYNAEAEDAVRAMRPFTLESAIARLGKAKDAIVKLGATMQIRITDHYHELRVGEMELTADYLAKVAEEKEQERAHREQLREEEKARREIEREQERLRKELEHYLTVLAAYQAQGNHGAAGEAQTKLDEISDGIDGLNRRAANIRAGYVYVISNVGAFGPNMVKVGLTRRVEPMDRVRELGDASVPFRYDVHLMVFSDDAVGLETHLHHALADRRVNMVNNRREFFYASPADLRAVLDTLQLNILSYVEEPEAIEWHQSQTARQPVEPPAVAAES